MADKWRNKKLSLVAKVRAKSDDHEMVGYVQKPSLRRMCLGRGKVYVYLKTDRGRVNVCYDRKAYKARYLELDGIFNKKLKRRFRTLKETEVTSIG